eukprot:TRINITY_DN7200_c0_g2_i1.p1 TRINITY_DN7200_c0_g2~~TRINITY_DN7200_c0_g2_i1.p1  ORF type:complete len:547 (+),score=113.76 TRINITY_DN7200_c0_g2_i1:122-1762(+)
MSDPALAQLREGVRGVGRSLINFGDWYSTEHIQGIQYHINEILSFQASFEMNFEEEKRVRKAKERDALFMQQYTKCAVCKKDAIDLVQIGGCSHSYCRACFKGYILESHEEEPPCCRNTCQMTIKANDMAQVFSELEIENRRKEMLENCVNLQSCPNCKSAFELEEQEIDVDAFRHSNPHIHGSDDSIICREKYRIKCRNMECQKEFCTKCGLCPYHDGFDCEEYKNRKWRCFECENMLTEEEQASNGDVGRVYCSNKSCQDASKEFCTSIQPCGHLCYGFAGESTKMGCPCVGCLHEDCVGEIEECAFCGSDMIDYPSIRLNCGHLFHVQCIENHISLSGHMREFENGKSLSYGFLKCPSCTKDISHPLICNEQFASMILLRDSTERLAARVFENEKMNEKSDYVQGSSNLQYAFDKLNFYLCSNCDIPYYGGAKACGAAGEPSVVEPKKCSLCASKGKSCCDKHGNGDNIIFKCQFCCKTASFFCWGTTHFCVDCHERQCKHDYLNKYPKDRLPKCVGKCCRFYGHEIGEEYSICSLCESEVYS